MSLVMLYKGDGLRGVQMDALTQSEANRLLNEYIASFDGEDEDGRRYYVLRKKDERRCGHVCVHGETIRYISLHR